MKDFPSCFGESGIQIMDSSSSSSKSSQNLVTCLYRANPKNHSCTITITWTKQTMGGQCLSIGIDDSGKSLCKLDTKPSIFSKWKGSKSLESNTSKIFISWDLSNAKFGPGPEPVEAFYVAVLLNHEMVLLVGDMIKEAYEKTSSLLLSSSNAACIARKEYVFGKSVYKTKVQFGDDGRFHEVSIECDVAGVKDPSLEIRIDRKRVMEVRRLCWKFRGNQSITMDGELVEVYWDVYNWLFGVGNAVFMFSSLNFTLILYAWKND